MWKFAAVTPFLLFVVIDSEGPSAVYISAADIKAAIQAMPEGRFFVEQIRMIDAGGYNVGVGVVQRPVTTTPTAIQHHQHTETYYILEGRGTFVSGGALVAATPLDPDSPIVQTLVGPSTRGTSIEGGTSREVRAGDVIIVPAGAIHGFSEVREALTYLAFRVDPDQLVKLK
ncbi:MAG: hypothetical protein HYW06_07645 [Gemmatimonadetes bacterium]|nr:hypothetical protein [Gemmatimonadota bacterium]